MSAPESASNPPKHDELLANFFSGVAQAAGRAQKRHQAGMIRGQMDTYLIGIRHESKVAMSIAMQGDAPEIEARVSEKARQIAQLHKSLGRLGNELVRITDELD